VTDTGASSRGTLKRTRRTTGLTAKRDDADQRSSVALRARFFLGDARHRIQIRRKQTGCFHRSTGFQHSQKCRTETRCQRGQGCGPARASCWPACSRMVRPRCVRKAILERYHGHALTRTQNLFSEAVQAHRHIGAVRSRPRGRGSLIEARKVSKAVRRPY